MVKGPCAKQKVICVIENNGHVWVGTNYCLNPQDQCPRDIEGCGTGEGYHLCKEVCRQTYHAEEDAANRAGQLLARGGTAYIFGHYYTCSRCKKALEEIGVRDIIILGRR